MEGSFPRIKGNKRAANERLTFGAPFVEFRGFHWLQVHFVAQGSVQLGGFFGSLSVDHEATLPSLGDQFGVGEKFRFLVTR
jgi:hypothetical protein